MKLKRILCIEDNKWYRLQCLVGEPVNNIKHKRPITIIPILADRYENIDYSDSLILPGRTGKGIISEKKRWLQLTAAEEYLWGDLSREAEKRLQDILHGRI